MRTPAICLLLLAASTTRAAPIDCTDWVFIDPALSCSVLLGFTVPDQEQERPWWNRGEDLAVDNEGHMLVVQQLSPDHRIEILRRTADFQVELLGYLETNRNNGIWLDRVRLETGRFVFDPIGGRLIVPLRSTCAGTSCPGAAPYGGGTWVAAITGFRTLHDTLPRRRRP